MDIDATIVIAHSEKENAAATWKKTFGFHPLAAFADHSAAGTGEALGIVLRPGNAGSNTAAEHIEVARLAQAQLPRRLRRRVLIRTDSGGGTHEFLAWLTGPGRRLHYSVGMTITDDIAPPSSPCRTGFGNRPMTPTGRRGRVPGSPKSPGCWTWPAGQPGCG